VNPQDSEPQPDLIVTLVNDLFFQDKIESVARLLGFRVEETANATSFVTALRETAPALGIVNLAARGIQALDVIRQVKGDPATASVPLLAFGPHVDTATLNAARQAGCNLAVANSRLVRELPQLIQQLTDATGKKPGDGSHVPSPRLP
jgi:DNA-binding NarL/FixJ family response regulator